MNVPSMLVLPLSSERMMVGPAMGDLVLRGVLAVALGVAPAASCPRRRASSGWCCGCCPPGRWNSVGAIAGVVARVLAVGRVVQLLLVDEVVGPVVDVLRADHQRVAGTAQVPRQHRPAEPS